MSKHPDTYQYAGGRSIYRNGQPFVYLNRSEEGAYVNPSEADAFARFCAEAPAVLRDLMGRAEGLDARLLAMTGNTGDGVRIGEVVRAAELLSLLNNGRA